ncbi:hypothetical protein BHE74_00016936 [Ensete ventricosum]|nr:hypothetical protein BHE74_00016936 [Ensete ventricosum]
MPPCHISPMLYLLCSFSTVASPPYASCPSLDGDKVVGDVREVNKTKAIVRAIANGDNGVSTGKKRKI